METMRRKSNKMLSLTDEVLDALEEEGWGNQSYLVENLLRDYYDMEPLHDDE